MAWAGNHLAARGETQEERFAWRAFFTIFTLVALVGGFIVLNQQEKEHRAEIDSLKSGLRSGVREEMATALIDYNNAHPQHQITAEQFTELTKFVNKVDLGKYAQAIAQLGPAVPNGSNPKATPTDQNWFVIQAEAKSLINRMMYVLLPAYERRQKLMACLKPSVGPESRVQWQINVINKTLAEDYERNYAESVTKTHRDLLGYIAEAPSDDSISRNENYRIRTPAFPEQWEERVITLCSLLSRAQNEHNTTPTCSVGQLSKDINTAKIQECDQ
jgi:hypothetical protein